MPSSNRLLLLITACLVCCATAASVCGEAPPDISPSFINDVQPLLTRHGCNSGGCHGKLAGQNGFRLSLRGYAPEEDHRALTEEEFGRRLDLLNPEQSLLLLKATAQLSHGGGKLFGVDDPPFATLLKWVRHGAPGIVEGEPRVTHIAATPAHKIVVPGESLGITVEAWYSDETTRDVTALAQFHSNDSSFAEVTPEGEVNALRHGEVSIVVSFQGLVDTVVLTMPYDRQVDSAQFAQRFNEIDAHVMNKLEELRIPPSPLCDDATFLRRVMLDLTGTLPTADEVREFVAEAAENKRERLVDRLLERPEFVDYWTLQLADLLQNRTERDHDVRGVKGVRSMHAWLREQVADNRPWNELAFEVLTAAGESDSNPAVGYYIVAVGNQQAHESEVADSAAQAFLGTRIGCAKCHNHPLERYTQDDYYHFVAFFSQVLLDRQKSADGPTVLRRGTRHLQNLEKRLANEQGELHKLRESTAEEKEIEQKQNRVTKLEQELREHRDAPPRVTQPRTGRPLQPQPLDRSPLEIPPQSDPRVALAQWMTAPENETFAAAMVNRLWKHFFAVGLVEPVDDLRETNPPSNGPLMDALVAELVESNYDLRHLMKLMVNSRSYQSASDTVPENATDTKFYSHFYPKRLPAEVLLDAVVRATGVPETFHGYPLGTRAVQLPGPQVDSYFLTAFGRSDRVTACACERSGEVTLSQLLHLQNSDNLWRKINDPAGNLAKWLAEADSADALSQRLFPAVLGRMPDEKERELLREAYENGDPREAAGDLLWALLNAKEFTFNH